MWAQDQKKCVNLSIFYSARPNRTGQKRSKFQIYYNTISSEARLILSCNKIFWLAAFVVSCIENRQDFFFCLGLFTIPLPVLLISSLYNIHQYFPTQPAKCSCRCSQKIKCRRKQSNYKSELKDLTLLLCDEWPYNNPIHLFTIQSSLYKEMEENRSDCWLFVPLSQKLLTV